MEETRKRLKFEVLIERYLSNFLRILLTNLIFFVPLLVAIFAVFLLQSVVDGILLFVLSTVLCVFVFPFYAGLVMVCRNLARGDEDVSVFSTFVKGTKENYSRFLLYGAVFSLFLNLSYFSISIYSKLLSQSWIFYVLLFLCIIIALAVLFIFFYIPIMTVTFDLSLRNIFKNSFLMSFGEIKNNFFALIALVVVLAIGFTIVAFSTNAIVLIVLTLLLLALILPASCQFVVSFFVYDDMYASIVKRNEKTESIDKAILKAKQEHAPVEVVEDYSDVDISSLKDTDDYIFYKGKMMKQSVLLRLATKQKERENNAKTEE